MVPVTFTKERQTPGAFICLSEFAIVKKNSYQHSSPYGMKINMWVLHKRHLSPVDHWTYVFVSLDHVTYLTVQVLTQLKTRLTQALRPQGHCMLPNITLTLSSFFMSPDSDSRHYVRSIAKPPHLRRVNLVDTTISAMRSDKMKPRGLINDRKMDWCPSVR